MIWITNRQESARSAMRRSTSGWSASCLGPKAGGLFLVPEKAPRSTRRNQGQILIYNRRSDAVVDLGPLSAPYNLFSSATHVTWLPRMPRVPGQATDWRLNVQISPMPAPSCQTRHDGCLLIPRGSRARRRNLRNEFRSPSTFMRTSIPS